MAAYGLFSLSLDPEPNSYILGCIYQLDYSYLQNIDVQTIWNACDKSGSFRGLGLGWNGSMNGNLDTMSVGSVLSARWLCFESDRAGCCDGFVQLIARSFFNSM
jgi:hypothetical protein